MPSVHFIFLFFHFQITPTTTKPSVRSYDEESCKSTTDPLAAVSSVASPAPVTAHHDDAPAGASTAATAAAAAPTATAFNEIVVISSNDADAAIGPAGVGSGGSTDGLSRNDFRKSKSKMKIYLKKCKDALIGQQQQMPEDTCPITHHEAVSQSPNTSWYLDDEMPPREHMPSQSQLQRGEGAATQAKCTVETAFDADIKNELGHENNLHKDGQQLNSVIENMTSGDVQAAVEVSAIHILLHFQHIF